MIVYIIDGNPKLLHLTRDHMYTHICKSISCADKQKLAPLISLTRSSYSIFIKPFTRRLDPFIIKLTWHFFWRLKYIQNSHDRRNLLNSFALTSVNILNIRKYYSTYWQLDIRENLNCSKNYVCWPLWLFRIHFNKNTQIRKSLGNASFSIQYE